LNSWHQPHRIAAAFRRELAAYVNRFLPDWLKTGHLLPSHDQAFLGIADLMARRMITGVAVQNARSWRAAASQSMQGRRIYEALRQEREGPLAWRLEQLVQHNARLIRSLPLTLALRTDRYIAERQAEGIRSSDITKELRSKLPQLAEWHVRLIARTETAKAETAVTRARAENLNIDWYAWASSEDERVRTSHRNMDKVIVAWSDPPAPEQLIGIKSTLGHYNGGSSPNCRCLCLPVISLDQISWPARVYTQGRIWTLTRAAFSRLNRMAEAA
jgi:SPP1 gp7 family putative phage head morphogenesis protein